MPNDEREVVVKFAGSDLVRSLDDRVSDALLKTEVQVRLRSTLFEKAEGTHNRNGHALAFASDLEVHERTLSLSSPVAVGRDLERAKSIGLFSELLRRGK